MMRLAILISGRGSNMLRLADVIDSRTDQAQIVLVAANKPCQRLDSAAGAGLPMQLLDRRDFADKSAQEDALAAAIEAAGADWILLAGYMAILSASFVDRFPDRIINIHPSLLPDLKGLDTHARALSAGYRRHGATVHLVTPALDDGPILLQAALTVGRDETESELAARVLALEHALYPFVILALAAGDLRIIDGNPHWRPGARSIELADTTISDVLKKTVIWP